MSRSNPVGSKHTVHFATPALAAFPAVGDAATAANGRVALYRINADVISPTGGGGSFGPKIFTFENVFGAKGPGTNPADPKSVTLSIEFCPDNVDANWIASTAALNNTAVTQVVIPPGVRRSFDVLCPANTPYLRITAMGGGVIEMTIDNDSGLERIRPVGLQG